MTVIEAHRIVLSNGHAKVIRSLAQARAGFARDFADSGEPHARARARVRAVEDDFARSRERALIFGEHDAR